MTSIIVIGSGGLLGKHVVAASRDAESAPFPVPWSSPVGAKDALAAIADRIADSSRTAPVRIAWCAGAGFVGATSDVMMTERDVVVGFLEGLTRRRVAVESVFLASSAGGVYAGSRADPITEQTAEHPLAEYGAGKLRVEAAVRAWGEETRTPTVIGRISNLYGPGQNLAKPQGLISQLVRASILREPLTIFVPLDTVRDYLFARDAAGLVHDCLERATVGPAMVTTKILAAGRGTTIGELVADLRRVRKSRPPVVFASTPLTSQQPKCLRFRSTVWPELERRPRTPLSAGLGATVDDQLKILGSGRLQRRRTVT